MSGEKNAQHPVQQQQQQAQPNVVNVPQPGGKFHSHSFQPCMCRRARDCKCYYGKGY